MENKQIQIKYVIVNDSKIIVLPEYWGEDEQRIHYFKQRVNDEVEAEKQVIHFFKTMIKSGKIIVMLYISYGNDDDFIFWRNKKTKEVITKELLKWKKKFIMTKWVRISCESWDFEDIELFEKTFEFERFDVLDYYFLPEKTFEFYTKQLTPESKADERIIWLLKEFVVEDDY